MELDDKLMFDIDADLEADDRVELGLGTPRCRSCRPRFPPYLAGAEAYTREINDNIDNTHLQHGLKRHFSAHIQKAQVCSFFSSLVKFGYVDMHANW